MSAAFASLMGTEARTSLWGQVPIHGSHYTHFSGLDGVGAEVTRPGASGSSWSPLAGWPQHAPDASGSLRVGASGRLGCHPHRTGKSSEPL